MCGAGGEGMDPRNKELYNKLHTLARECEGMGTTAGKQAAHMLYIMCGELIGGSLYGLARAIEAYGKAQKA